ncbi:hypothetical protein [Virgibacillus sp. Bac332]|uniref:hypothetical protein n=1 Tax=Virgibacillus sp. Bac332 TaxID=2419842 RepID=UPI0013CE907D|nr:hypothetical protein [Virgibacillus sp. Bac332]
MNQIILPLDLEIKLQENDIAYTIHHVIESISVQLVRIASGFILHITGSKPPPHDNDEPNMDKWGSTASKCPIGLKAFRSYPCGTNNQ